MTKKICILVFIFFSVFEINAANELPGSQTQQTPTQSLTFIQHIEQWYKENTNYFSITALMAAESSILPVPSEMVIPPAVYVAMEPDSKLSIFWIVCGDALRQIAMCQVARQM